MKIIRRDAGPERRRWDTGPFWVASIPCNLAAGTVSVTVRLRKREWTLGVRLPGWVE